MVDRIGSIETAGKGYDDNGAVYAVDTGHTYATNASINIASYAPAYISHELHHTLIDEPGDFELNVALQTTTQKFEHFKNPNANSKDGDLDDVTRVLWNYNHFRTLAQNFAPGDPRINFSLKIDDVDDLPTSGTFQLGSEEFTYAGVDTGNDLLTGCTKTNTGNAFPRYIGDPVRLYFNGNESMKQIRYGLGTTKFMHIP